MPFTGTKDVYPAKDVQLTIADESVTAYGTPIADSATNYGIVPCTADPTVDISAGPPIDAGATYSKGTAGRKTTEFLPARRKAAFMLPTIADEVMLGYGLTSLFQHGCTRSGTGPWSYVGVSWSGQPGPTATPKYKGLTVRKSFGGTDTSATHQLPGGIVTTMKLSGASGQAMTLQLDGVGIAGSAITVVTPSTTALVGVNHLAFDAMTMYLTAIGGTHGAALTPLAFDLTLTNNGKQAYKQSLNPLSVFIGSLEGSGSIRFSSKTDSATFVAAQLAGTAMRLFVQWGSTKMVDATTGAWGAGGTLTTGGVAFGCEVKFGETKPSESEDISVFDIPFTIMENTHTIQMEVDTAKDLTLALSA